MKYRPVFVTLLSFLLLALSLQADASQLLRPRAGQKMWLPIAGKERLYYRLETDRPLHLTVKGPLILKCIVRVIPLDSLSTETAYHIVLSSASEQIKSVETSSTPSSLRWRDSLEIATHSRSFTVRLAKGVHEIDIHLDGDAVKAAGIRFLAQTPHKTSARSPLYPSTMASALTIIVDEQLRNYFLATHEEPITLDVIGPTHLRVTSRLVYQARDKGTIRYGIEILGVKGKKITPDLTTSKSLVAQSKEHSNWNFGKARSFTVAIPRGQHHLIVRPRSTDIDIALRFSLPKSSVTP